MYIADAPYTIAIYPYFKPFYRGIKQIMKKLIRHMTVSYKPGSRSLGVDVVPCIRLTNNFLTQHGFNYNDKIVVVYEKGKVTLFTQKAFNQHTL